MIALFLALLGAVTALPLEPRLDTGKIAVRSHEFTQKITNYLILPGSSKTPEDETLLIWTSDGRLEVSQDQGTQWTTVRNVNNVINVFKSATKDNQVYAFSSDSLKDNKVFVSWDRARTFEEMKLPAKPSLVYSLVPHVVSFHPNHPDWMLFSGQANCEQTFECPSTGFLSKDRGKTWTKIHEDVLACQWIHGLADQPSDDFMYCFLENPDKHKDLGAMNVVWSTDYFATKGELKGVKKVMNMIADQPFMIAGYTDDHKELQAAVSRDGINFEALKYPPNIKDHQGGLVVIKSDDANVLLYEGTHGQKDTQFGNLVRSGGMGANFVSILENVNRAHGTFESYVDVDRITSVEGVMLANVVTNADDVAKIGAHKDLATYISHSNGAKWMRIQAPEALCKAGEPCYLNFHGHSERLDSRNSPSSPTAVGMFFGRGNVGQKLGDLHTAHTYLTRDGGITWEDVIDRPMFWEFGDSGSIVILIDALQPTDSLMFSLDEGSSWSTYKFSDTLIKIKNIITVPSDTSRKFNIIASPPVASGLNGLTIQIDFSQVLTTACKESDFVWWEPPHPQLQDQCMLGHKLSYYRRKPKSQCLIGKQWEDDKPTSVKKKLSNCACSRNDYECDYGYELDLQSQQCKLIAGQSTPDQQSQCTGGAIAWHEVTGYRKIVGSTCENGEQLDKPDLYACPGKEEEFKKQFPGGKRPPPSQPSNPPPKDPPSGGAPPSDKPPKDPNPSDPEAPNKSSGGFSRFVFKTLLVLLFLLLAVVGMAICVGVLGKVVNKHLESRGISLMDAFRTFFNEASSSINLPDGSPTAESTGERVKSVFSDVVSSIKFGISKLPFVGSSHPYDHLGFYSRTDDDERTRILDSDSDVFEEEGDNRYEDNFDIGHSEEEDNHEQQPQQHRDQDD